MIDPTISDCLLYTSAIAHRNVQANPKVRVEILVIYFYFSAFFKMRIALSASAALSKAK
jgi:hypothetical protein